MRIVARVFVTWFACCGVQRTCALALWSVPLVLLESCGVTQSCKVGVAYWTPRLHGDITVDGTSRNPDSHPRANGLTIEGHAEGVSSNATMEYRSLYYPTSYGLPDTGLRATREEFLPWHQSVLIAGGPKILELGGTQKATGRNRRPSTLRLDSFVGVRGNLLTLEGERHGFVSGGDEDRKNSKDGTHDETAWADPVAGLLTSWWIHPRIGLRAVGEAGGFGVASNRTWLASLAGMVCLGHQDRYSVWLSAGWQGMAVDREGGSGSSFHLDTKAAGPFLGLEFWF